MWIFGRGEGWRGVRDGDRTTGPGCDNHDRSVIDNLTALPPLILNLTLTLRSTVIFHSTRASACTTLYLKVHMSQRMIMNNNSDRGEAVLILFILASYTASPSADSAALPLFCPARLDE